MPEKPVVVAEVTKPEVNEKVNVEEFIAFLKSDPVIVMIIKAFKALLNAFGKWNKIISWLNSIKDKIPGTIDDEIIDALVVWLETL